MVLAGKGGLGAFNASAAVTYKDPTGVNVQGTVDPGIFNQDLAIMVGEGQSLYDTTRHSDDWLVTVCVPLKLIAAAASITVPPASVAALLLVPDLIIQVSGTGGYFLAEETVTPQPGQIMRTVVPFQRKLRLPVQYSSGARQYLDTENTTWGLAVGLPCGPGIGASATIPIEGYSMVERVPLQAVAEVEIDLPISALTAPPRPPAQPMPRPKPGQPIRQQPPAQVTPEVTPQVSPQVQPETAPQVSPTQPETEQAPTTPQQSPGAAQPKSMPVQPR